LNGQPRQAFHYVDKGMLATIGRGAAVAHIGRFKISGFLAWLFWLFVHILFLIGFRNRVLVMLQWAWSYVSFDRGARLITEPLKEPLVRFDPNVAPSCHESPAPRPQDSAHARAHAYKIRIKNC
jgi:NADH dehydrogenase